MKGGCCFLMNRDSRMRASISESVLMKVSLSDSDIIFRSLASPVFRYWLTRFLKFKALPMYRGLFFESFPPKADPPLAEKMYIPGQAGSFFICSLSWPLS